MQGERHPSTGPLFFLLSEVAFASSVNLPKTRCRAMNAATSCTVAQALQHGFALTRRHCHLASQRQRSVQTGDLISVPKVFFLPSRLRQNRCYCVRTTAEGECTMQNTTLQQYRYAFAKRMAMAGLEPHHRIAIGVSGGADSMALCLLTSAWKCAGRPDNASGYINGLLAIIVDHGLRDESAIEANYVRDLVSRMGIECEVSRCDWTTGKPNQGHLQEEAHKMRYHIFENICLRRQISVLLIAHHSDDQAELFVLRLSRNSGVLGLAGMAFMSQLFPNCCRDSLNCGSIILVRPLLEFSKGDLYEVEETNGGVIVICGSGIQGYDRSGTYATSTVARQLICQASKQRWVEDPSNKSLLFARNRIRSSLGIFLSSSFRTELQATISACRITRSYVDQVCYNLIQQSVVIMDHGYIVIDLLKLDPSNIEDLCLSKFITLFPRGNRPVRGGSLKLLLNYIRTLPCKNSLTAATCYLCAVPGSKGTKVAVCWSSDSPQESKPILSRAPKHNSSFQAIELEDIIRNAQHNLPHAELNRSDVPFLHPNSSGSMLDEAMELTLLSKSNIIRIASILQRESELFISKEGSKNSREIKHERKYVGTLFSEPVHAGDQKYFMNRFLVSWKLYETVSNDDLLSYRSSKNKVPDSSNCEFISFMLHDGQAAILRCMQDTDWMHLIELERTQAMKESQGDTISSQHSLMCNKNTISCSSYLLLSATRALLVLRSIPVAARRGLPVLVDPEGNLLSIPVSHTSYELVPV